MPVAGGVVAMGSPRGRHTFRRASTALVAAAVMLSALALPAAAAPPAHPVPEAAPTARRTGRAGSGSTTTSLSHRGCPRRIWAFHTGVGLGGTRPVRLLGPHLSHLRTDRPARPDRRGAAARGRILRWFICRGRAITTEEFAERGDLVIYNNGSHIGIYLGDGRVLSAITSGVTVHSLRGITVQPTAYLKVDWTGEGGPLADPSTVRGRS